MSTRKPLMPIQVAAQAAKALVDDACQPDRQNRSLDGYLYAVRSPGHPLVKIGRTTNPISRLKGLQMHCPVPLELLGLAHGETFEGIYHSRYDDRRRHGEWFELAFNPLELVNGKCVVCSGLHVHGRVFCNEAA